MASIAFTNQGEPIVPSVNGGTYFGGGGKDTYIFDPRFIPANAKIAITDTDGPDRVQLADGFTIVSSSFANTAVKLKLNTGAEITIFNAHLFTYDIGATSFDTIFQVAPGTIPGSTYAQFAASLGVTALPTADGVFAAGTVNYSTTNGNGGGTTPTFSASGAAAAAEGGSATFTVTLSAAQTTATTVAYALTGSGGAIMGTDAGSSTPSQNTGTLTFAAGETTKSVTVPIITDQVTPETGEGVTITLSSPSTGTALAVATATTAITDVPPSLYTLVANVPTVLEGSAAVFTATRTGDISAAKTLTFTTVGDSSSTGAAATVGVDSTPASGTLTFAAGSNTATFSVNTVNDNTFESVEGLKVSLFDGNTSVGTSTMLLIADAATYAIAAASSSADEGGTAKFNVTTNVADGTVGYTISGTGITAADTTDGKLTGTATIVSGVATISVPLSLDKITEGTETLRVTLADGITSATIAVNDTSVNEAPVFVSADTAFSVAENSTAVTTATATDATALTYSISGTDSAKFSVDSATGAIAFKTAPNFEVDAKSYAVTVTASDGSLSASKNLTVAVTDVNEAPTFAAATATASYAENGSAAVGTYTATDVDAGDTLTYTVSGADAAMFSVSSTGALSFKATPNFEAPASSKGTNVYDVNVVASDKAGLTATQAVTVTVTDVNEHPTSVAAASTDARENQTAVGTYATTDVDAGQTATLVYALGGDDAALFDLNTTTAVLSFKAAPNFEAPGSKAGTNAYSVTVTATDTGTLSTTTPQAVTVNVTNVNEMPNSVAAATASVDENLTAVGTYATTDVDAGDTLTYTLTGADAAKFAITSAGALSFVKAPDFEAPGSAAASNTYTVNVVATDAGGLSVATPQVITVNVNNVNDNSATTPTDTNSAVDAVPENSAQGTIVGITASSTDADSGSTITYSLSSNVGGYFQIDATTGVVSTSATPLNYEEKSGGLPVLTHDLTVLATSSDGSTASKTFTVTTQNVNEKPVVTASQEFKVTENTSTLTNSAGGTAYTAATDPDGDVPTGWIITKMNDVAYNSATSPFQIDTFSGLISVQSGKTVDFDPSTGGVNTYTLSVTARDGEPLTSDEVKVTINVADANDIAPVITSGATATVAENTAITTAVYTVTTTDADTVNGTTTYTLGGADAALFDVSAAGAVTFKASPNYEAPLDSGANNVYDITVTANDGVNNSAATAVAISVTDVNDNSPVFGVVATPFTIAENTTAVGTAAATDADATASLKAITYSLSGTDAAYFSVDSSGVVTANGTGLNFEDTHATAYSFNVVATNTDTTGTATATTQAMVVNVTDVNEAPTATDATLTARSGQNTTVYLNDATKVNQSSDNYVLGNVVTTDVDTTAPNGAANHLITSVTQPTSGGTVSLAADGKSFVVASALGLTSDFKFTYTVKDVNGTGLSSTATVNVTPTSNLGGTPGNDVLVGTTAAENLDGIGGNDTIIGGGGLDTISGGDGNDRVTFNDAAAQINGGADNDILVVNADAIAGAFDLSQSSQQNIDTLSKNSQGNRVTTRAFENIDATLSANPLILNVTPLAGTTLAPAYYTDNVTPTAGTLATFLGGDNAATTSIIGSSSGDALYFSRATGTGVVVNGLAGNDIVVVDNTGATRATGSFNIDGGAGNDWITVTNTTAAHTILGGDGTDTINMGSGKQSVDGGAGNDTIVGGVAAGTSAAAPVTINGGDGDDNITAGSGGFNSVDGGAGNDTITDAAADTNTIIGGAGNDSITAATNKANIDAGAGNDTVSITNAQLTVDDTIGGGADADTLSITAIADAGTTPSLASLTKVTGFEKLTVTGAANSSYTVAVADYVGLTEVTYNEDTTTTGKTVSITGLTVGAQVNLVHGATAGNNDRAIGSVTAALTTATGTTDSLTVNLVGNVAAVGTGSNNNVTTLVTTGFETLTVNSNSSGAALTTTLTNQNVVGTLTDANLTKLNLAGASALTIGAFAQGTAATTIASTMTGDLNLTVSGTSATTFTGGNGKNTVTVSGTTLENTDSFTGGTATTDVLAATINGTTATTGKFTIAGFESVNLDVTGASTVDASTITGANVIAFSTGTGGVTVTKLAAGATVGLGVAGATAYTGTANFALADETGTADVLNVKLGVAATQTTGAITTAGIETINITEDIVATGAQVVTLTSAAAKNVNLSGTTTNANTQNYTLASLNAATTAVDASGLVSSGVFTATLTSTTASTLKGTGGDNVIAAGAGSTTFTIGSNFDSTDSVTGGAGTVDVLNATVSATQAAYNATKVTDVETINLTSNFAVTVADAGATGTAGLLDAEVKSVSVSGTGNFTAIAEALGSGAGFTGGSATFDASGSSGVIEITQAVAGFVATNTFKGGTGTTDVLHVSASTSTLGAVTVNGFETMELNNAAGNSSFAMTNVTGLNNLVLTSEGASGNVTLTNLAAGTAVSLGFPASGAGTAVGTQSVLDGRIYTLVASSTSGASDALTVNLNKADVSGSGVIVVADGIENLTFNQMATGGTSFALKVQDANTTNPVTMTITGGHATAGTNTLTFVSGGIESNVTSITNTGTNSMVMGGGSRVGSTAMTITGGSGADTLIMRNVNDSIDGGASSTGGDTLALVYSGIAGAVVDLTSTTDQVTFINGSSNTGASQVQKGFENVDASLYVGGGVDVTFAAAGSVMRGSTGADVVRMAAGADTLRLLAPADNSNDQISGFTATGASLDTIALLEGGGGWNAASSTASGTGAAIVAGDFETGRANVAAIAEGDTNKIVRLSGTQTTTQLSTGTGAASNSYVVAFNSTTGRGEIWYDNDWFNATNRAQVASLTDITSLAGVTALTFSNFLEYTSPAQTFTATAVGANFSGSALNDTFRFTTAQFTDATKSTVEGGGGTDTIEITDAGTTIADADFVSITAVDILKLTGASTVTLGTTASTAGIATVTAGAGATTVTANNSIGLAVDASSIVDGVVLTLADGATSNFTVTGLIGDLTASTLAGTLGVTTGSVGNVAITAGSGNTTVAGTATATSVDATALVGAATLGLSGSSNYTVTALTTTGAVTSSGTGTVNITGAAGVQTINFTTGAATATVSGGAATDVVTLGDFTNSLSLGDDGWSITGGTGVDTITFTATQSATTVVGGLGADVITLPNGGNTISINDATVSVTGGTGVDAITFITTAMTNVTISGGGGADTVAAPNGANTFTVTNSAGGTVAVTGGNLVDIITTGTTGTYSVTGGAGADVITLGTNAGADKVIFAAVTDGSTAAATFTGHDTISGFVGGQDKISVLGNAASVVLSGAGAAQVASTAFTGTVSGAFDANGAVGGAFITGATAADLTSYANVATAIGAIANETIGESAYFAVANTAGTQYGIYHFASATADDAVTASTELKLLGVITVASGTVVAGDFIFT